MLKYKTSPPHLSHGLLVHYQSIFTAFADIASRTDYQNLVLMELEIPLAYCSELIKLFKDLIRDTKRTIASSTLGIYQLPARSYIAPIVLAVKLDKDTPVKSSDRRNKREKNGDGTKHHEEAKKKGG